MTKSKFCPALMPLLAILASGSAAFALPSLPALTVPAGPQQLETEMSFIRVDTSSDDDDRAWFYFGDDEDNDHGERHDDDDDDDDGAGRTFGRNCPQAQGQAPAPNDPACPALPKNGLFTPGTAPQVNSN